MTQPSQPAEQQSVIGRGTSSFDKNDVGFGNSNWHEYTDTDKINFLKHSWFPPSDFEWPYSERKDGQKLRRKYLGPQHLSGVYQCFAYSMLKGGVYCKTCAVFGPSESGGSQIDRLVKSPLQKCTHLTGQNGYLSCHLKKRFHKDSQTKANAFIAMVKSSRGDIAQQMNSAAAPQVEKNQSILSRIILSIEFLGRLGLPLREHRDSGDLPQPSNESRPSSSSIAIDYSQGNFRATL